MQKDHKKNHTIALIGTTLVTAIIVVLWVRVLLPMERAKNKQQGSSTADLIKSVTPDIPQKQVLPQTDSISSTEPLLDESSYQQ